MDNTIELPTLRCLRCGHTWIPRKPAPPKNCPRCISPYWNKPKWKEGKNRIMTDIGIIKILIFILVSLAADCEKQIQPYRCILEPTKKEHGFHYKVPNSTRRQVIAWGNPLPTGSKEDIAGRPCVKVGVYGGLLKSNDPTISKYWNPKGYWGNEGEAQAAIYEINDDGYRAMSYALIMAAKELIGRSGGKAQLSC